ncbi:ABC superfamily ATP binding cassette transporter membrane domain protein [Mycobacterium xenopi 4042]|uniref:ABC superfamily ATP binding cassette transporter membrane domain protein n=1 Tax=Mycobacterium xenopi 4042 TaxID=1299334 RepID=X8E0K7_MYCXE|nr:ABC superfamily ATP binding cassette transporter membrane domain protein [Mycobacterium xenopi 4042]
MTASCCRCGCCCCRCRWPLCTSAASRRCIRTRPPGLRLRPRSWPAGQRALYGQIYADNLGAVGIWKAGMFHLLIAIAVILTVIRHTRADEETGRAELLDSTSVGRYASLTAALLLSSGPQLPPARSVPPAC